MRPGEDDTIRMTGARAPSPPAARTSGLAVATGIGVAVLFGAAWLGWKLLATGPAPAVVTPASPAPPAIAAAETFPEASEAAILANAAPALRAFRLADNPAILVLDFPTLAEQARMMNRLAALVEKTGLPRDRVLDDAALDAAVRADGSSAETFYYGHNYRAADVARFFLLADRDGIRLNAEEERLRRIAHDMGWLDAASNGALVSVPHAGVESWLDARARATMLRHELSHGEFFTNPAYAAAVWRFWRETLTEEERNRLRGILAQSNYDPSLEEVMANEAQAFLFHTADERFFTPSAAGFAVDRYAVLRAAFLGAMPPGWLRDAMEGR